ncbi:MAG: choice-of-anchor V domain-containing protein [Pyrinomonadaceae bacterium]
MNKIKLICVLCFVVFAIGAFFTDSGLVATVQSFSGGPPFGATGAPGEADCTACHAQNAGPGIFTISAPANYSPGQTYQIQVQHTTTDATRLRWGFELTALNGSNLAAGTFASTSAFTQTISGNVSGNTRFYAEHNSAGTFAGTSGGASWMFNWTAPATNVGPVTFYAAGNQANNNGSSSGDQIYTTNTVSLAPTPTATNTPTNTATATLTATNTPTPTPCVGTWSEQAHPTASDGAASDSFGVSVAISGDTAVVGAFLDDNAGGTDAGSAYIFVRSGTVWTLQQKLTASDGVAGDRFGVSVAISGDTVVVGADAPTSAGGTGAGSAYVFTRSGTVWTQQQKLTASDGGTNDEFGDSVSISGDTVVVGAPFDDTASGTNAGSAYVYTRSGTVWTEQQKLTASDAAADDLFGLSVALSGDTVVAGVYADDDVGFNSGSAWVFTRSGTVWSEQQKLTASDGAIGDDFGISVAISGETVVVGSSFDDNVGFSSGSAYVFTRSGTVWSEQQKLTASDAAAGDEFGVTVSVSGDTVVVGSRLDDTAGGVNAGSAYVFTRSAVVWSEQQKLTASDGAADDFFNRVAISGDTIIVGSFFDDTPAGSNAGSAYIFQKNCPTPTPTATATNTPTDTPTNTPTPTATQTPSISGTVTYGNAASPPRFISNATVTGTGSPNIFTTTDAPGGTAGQYTLTGFGAGSYTVSLSKTTGQNGINSLDAARIAQHVAGTLFFSNDNQRVTADVSGNGAISSNDAAFIARFVTALGAPFGNTGQWRFYVAPGPTFPVGSSPTSRTYSSVTSNITGEDYVGLLIGETTGNWNNTGARPARAVDSGQWTVDSENGREKDNPITVTVQSLTASAEKEIVVPVNVEGVAGKGIISYEFDLRYDPAVIQPLVNPVDVAGTVSRGLSVVANAHEPGLLRVVVYGAFPIDEDGVLLNLRFAVVGSQGAVSPLAFEPIMFNEGETGVMVTDGRIEVLARSE